jgi:hypothetical protein
LLGSSAIARTGHSDTRRIGQRQIALRRHRLGRGDLELAGPAARVKIQRFLLDDAADRAIRFVRPWPGSIPLSGDFGMGVSYRFLIVHPKQEWGACPKAICPQTVNATMSLKERRIQRTRHAHLTTAQASPESRNRRR